MQLRSVSQLVDIASHFDLLNTLLHSKKDAAVDNEPQKKKHNSGSGTHPSLLLKRGGGRKKEKGKTDGSADGSADGSELEIWQFLLSAALMLHRNELRQADACCGSRSLSPVAVSQVLSVSFSLNGARKRAGGATKEAFKGNAWRFAWSEARACFCMDCSG